MVCVAERVSNGARLQVRVMDRVKIMDSVGAGVKIRVRGDC